MAKWSGRLRDIRGYYSDSWDDFMETILEVAGRGTLPQVLGIMVVVTLFCIVTMLLWGGLSLLIALPVWGLWNYVMPDLGLPEIGYWKAYCLTLLCAILFRGNSVHLEGLKEQL